MASIFLFDLSAGAVIPQDSGYLLLSALTDRFPFLHGRRSIQIAPIRGTRLRRPEFICTDHNSRLHIRGITTDQADQIQGSWVIVHTNVLGIGDYRELEMTGSTDLVSKLVILRDIVDAEEFKKTIEQFVPGAQITLGRRRALALKGRKYLGYSVHLKGLSMDASLAVQNKGIGRFTSMGCGVFYPGSKNSRAASRHA